MSNLPSRTGYRSVHHTDVAQETKDGHKFGYDGQAPEHAAMLSEKDYSSGVQHPPSKFRDESTIWQKCNAYWVWEVATSMVSLACLGVIIWALLTLDDNPKSNWPIALEPASFLSTFVTLSRSMMFVGVAAGIAQLRWLYYLGGPRRLDDLDSFDAASRGPMGSLLFFCRTTIHGVAPSFARFGAFVMVVALAMDPFVQQILTPYTRLQDFDNHADTWVLVTNTSGSTSRGGAFSDETRRRSLFGGLLGVPNPISYSCPSGNCTWPSFTSLGYDIACSDVASSMVRECVSGAGVLNINCTTILHTLPSANLSLTLQNGSTAVAPNANTTRAYTIIQSNTSDSFPFGYKDSTLFKFLIAQLLISTNNGSFDYGSLQNPSWNLTECNVKYCSKLYQGLQVSSGRLTDPLPRVLDVIPVANSTCWTQQPLTCQEFEPINVSAVPQGSDSLYHIPIDDTPVEVRTILLFDYNLTLSGNGTNTAANGAYNLATGLFWNANLTASFNNVATSLTNYLRTNSSPYQVRGTLQISTIYYNVHWKWFALPAALDLLGPIFLIIVIIYTAKGVKGEKLIWKTNTLPLLMHGLEGYQPYGYAGAETTTAILRTAKEMNVQLRRNADGEIRFVKT